MNGESPFEARLRNQPPRQLPPEWRREILSCAKTASRATQLPAPAQFGFRLWLASLLCPYQKAWVGLAAAWMLIFALNLASHDTEPALMAKVTPTAASFARLGWEVRERMLAELVGPTEPERRSTPDAIDRPRSERNLHLRTA